MTDYRILRSREIKRMTNTVKAIMESSKSFGDRRDNGLYSAMSRQLGRITILPNKIAKMGGSGNIVG